MKVLKKFCEEKLLTQIVVLKNIIEICEVKTKVKFFSNEISEKNQNLMENKII